eukprot:TRINITY_DN14584_c1_g1_i1.p1 TRINITY_DN14584_c1_g1~~TRINITY_DN14584_c1_g1_i1.p1  ORF type:complete len:336 (+),score=88.24 TRINITY_DN14584_c1_g1_i1:56-1063(+)
MPGPEAACSDAAADDAELPCSAHGVTMGLEGRLRQNILSDEYYEHIRELSWEALREELCAHEELAANAWGGAARLGIRGRKEVLVAGRQGDGSTTAPSPMWCILARALSLRLRAGQLRWALAPARPPHVRVLGVLYARLTLPPGELVEWLRGALGDTSCEVLISAPSARGEKTATLLARFTRNCLVEQRYLGTLFPRVPARELRLIRAAVGLAPDPPLDTDLVPGADAAGEGEVEEEDEQERKRAERYARLDELVEHFARKDHEEAVRARKRRRSPSGSSSSSVSSSRRGIDISPPRQRCGPAAAADGALAPARPPSAVDKRAQAAVRQLANLVS